MKVLIVNPPAHKIIEPEYDRPAYPRTALACLASYLRAKNIDVHVLDCKFDRISLDEGFQFIKQLMPDIVGFTAFTNEIMQAAEMAKRVKESFPAMKTVIGSVHLTSLPEQTLREFPQFDFGVVGEGEITFYELICNLNDAPEKLLKTLGLCFINPKDEFIFPGERSKILNQDELPLPAWDMFESADEYILQTLRGCPYACNFCMNPNGREVRARSPESVIKEIGFLVKNHKAKHIVFGDEIFSVNKARAVEICKLLISSGLNKKVSWFCQTHVRCIDLELAKLMLDANCTAVGLGIESGDEDKLKQMKKGTNIDAILSAVEILKKTKLPFATNFILGQPNETIKSALKTINFMVKLNPRYPVLGIMVPYPGTEIAKMIENGEGGYILQAKDWNDYNKQIGNSICFKDLSRRMIEILQVWGYFKVFIWNFRLFDLMKFIWRYKVPGLEIIRKLLIGNLSKPDQPKAF